MLGLERGSVTVSMFRFTAGQVNVPFKPAISSELDLGNIDEKFTRCAPVESPCNSLTNQDGSQLEEPQLRNGILMLIAMLKNAAARKLGIIVAMHRMPGIIVAMQRARDILRTHAAHFEGYTYVPNGYLADRARTIQLSSSEDEGPWLPYPSN